MCFSCICLFILLALIFVPYLFFLVSGDSLRLLIVAPLDFSINFFYFIGNTCNTGARFTKLFYDRIIHKT